MVFTGCIYYLGHVITLGCLKNVSHTIDTGHAFQIPQTLWSYAHSLAWELSSTCSYQTLHGSRPLPTLKCESASPTTAGTYPTKSMETKNDEGKIHGTASNRTVAMAWPMHGWYIRLWLRDRVGILSEAIPGTRNADRSWVEFSKRRWTRVGRYSPRMRRRHMGGTENLPVSWRYLHNTQNGSWCHPGDTRPRGCYLQTRLISCCAVWNGFWRRLLHCI